MSKFKFGWNDPRGGNMLGTIRLSGGHPTGLTDTPTEVLRNLWLAQFSSSMVTYDDMYEAEKRGETKVAQELANRSLIEQRKISRMDMESSLHYYKLLDNKDANR